MNCIAYGASTTVRQNLSRIFYKFCEPRGQERDEQPELPMLPVCSCILVFFFFFLLLWLTEYRNTKMPDVACLNRLFLKL